MLVLESPENDDLGEIMRIMLDHEDNVKVIDLSLIVHYNVEYLNGSQNPEFLTFKSDNKSLLWARGSPMYIDLMRNLKANVKSKDG